MNYYDPNSDRTSRRGGLIASLVYVVSLALIFWLVSFSSTVELTEQGILIDFGDSEHGAGTQDMESTDTPQQAASQSGEVTPEQLLTDDSSEVDISTQQIETPKKQTSEQQTISDEQEAEEIPREVNQRALFPGRTLSSDSSSQGVSDTPEGNQGDVSGQNDASAYDTGAGVEGVSWSLSGRSAVGRLPLPSYSENATGRVVIEIIVNENGKVTNATYRAQGSTTNNTQLVTAARNAALAAQFTPSDDFAQVGTITYTFILN